MKKLLTYGLLCMLLGLLPGGAPAAAAESPVILGGTGDESCYDTLPLPDGSVILSMATSGGLHGEPKYGGSVLKTWLVCLAPDGTTTWETVFGADRKGGYTTLHYLALNGDGTFSGTVRYEIDQRTQYHQRLTFSCADGSLLAEGEMQMNTEENDHIYRTYFADGGEMLTMETNNSNTSGTPRILRRIGADGTELWQLDTADIDLRLLEGWIATEYGSLLYGCGNDAATQSRPAVALLVDNSGSVLWSYQAPGVTDGDLNDAIVDTNGRLVALGFSREGRSADGSPVRFSQLAFCLDAKTGQEIWLKTTEQTDRKLPWFHLAETGGQYVLCGGSNDFASSVFETLDANGRALQYWTTSLPGYTRLTSKFFLWNGELWTVTQLEGANSDIALERVVIPDSQ